MQEELVNRVIELEKNLKLLATQVQDALNQQKVDLVKSSSRLEAFIRWQIDTGVITVDGLLEILNKYSKFRDSVIKIRSLETLPSKFDAVCDYNASKEGFRLVAEDLDFKQALEKAGGPSKDMARKLLAIAETTELREYLQKYADD